MRQFFRTLLHIRQQNVCQSSNDSGQNISLINARKLTPSSLQCAIYMHVKGYNGDENDTQETTA